MTPEQVFRAMSDLTRLRCLMLMQAEGELCVCELTHALDEIQPKISRHLAILRDSGIVSDRRQGQWIYYRIQADLPGWTQQVLAAGLEGARAQMPYCKDRERLSAMPNRPSNACCA